MAKNSAPDVEKIADDIKAMLLECAKELNSEKSRRKWTGKIKKELVKLGHGDEYKFWVNAKAPGADWEHDWLYDVTWVRYDKKPVSEMEDRRAGNRKLGRLVLAVESEWIDTDVVNDFEKLVVCRADLRVMIFNKFAKETVACAFQRLKSYVQANEQRAAGDRYLLCCWVGGRTAWEFDLGP
jgi:hypothetical protein